MTIAELFASYRANVIPPAASAVQIEECRRAFYAGSFALLQKFLEIGDEDISEDDGAAVLGELYAECLAFAAAVSASPPPAEAPAPPNLADGSSGYNVRNAEIEAALRELAGDISAKVPSGWGFTLQLFSFGAGGSLFYISNAKRDDMIRAMREFIRRHEQ